MDKSDKARSGKFQAAARVIERGDDPERVGKLVKHKPVEKLQ
jgi:hypothetical protein